MVVTREGIKAWMFEEYPNEDNDAYSFPDSVSIYDYLSTIEKCVVSSDSFNCMFPSLT